MGSIFEWLLNFKPGKLQESNWEFEFLTGHDNYIRLPLFGVLIFMIWLTIHCYRREGTVSKYLKGFLAFLRITVIGLIILVLFQPAIALSVTTTIYGKVISIFDDSRSMAFRDEYMKDGKQTPLGKELTKELKLKSTKEKIKNLKRIEIAKRMILQNPSVYATLSKGHTLEFFSFTNKRSFGGSTKSLAPVFDIKSVNTQKIERQKLSPKAKADLVKRFDKSMNYMLEQKLITKTQAKRADQEYEIWLVFAPTQAGQILDELEAIEKKYKTAIKKNKKLADKKTDNKKDAEKGQPAQAGTKKEADDNSKEKSAENKKSSKALPEKKTAGNTSTKNKKKTDFQIAHEEIINLLIKISEAPVKPGDLEAMLAKLFSKGSKTDIASAMLDVFRSSKGQRVDAVILYTDGQDTQEHAIKRIKTAREGARGERDMKIISVIVGDPTMPCNVEVAGIKIPRYIRAGMRVNVDVDIRNRNFGNRKGTDGSGIVRLYRKPVGRPWKKNLAGEKLVASKRFQYAVPKNSKDTSRQLQTVSMEIKTSEKMTGEFEFRAVIEPDNAELVKDDNYADAVTEISKRKLRILLISGDSGWEFQYIRNYFLRQPDLYSLSCWQQNSDPKISQLASSGMKLEQLPTKMDQLIQRVNRKDGTAKKGKLPPGFDVIMLYDPEPGLAGFDYKFMKMLEDYVSKFGGGLCYIASEKNTLDLLKPIKMQDGSTNNPIANLLPVVVTNKDVNTDMIMGGIKEKSYQLALTSFGKSNPVTQLVPNNKENVKIWRSLEGVFWTQNLLKVKLGARILAYSTDPNKYMKTSRKDRLPVIVTQPVGAGRVLYVGSDETWRWKSYDEGFFHKKFWGNVVQYLAPTKINQATIMTTEDKVAAGQKVHVEVEAYTKEYTPRKDATIALEQVDRKTGKVHKIHILKAVKDRPGRYAGDFIPDKTGNYILTVSKKLADPKRVMVKKLKVTLPLDESRKHEATHEILETALENNENDVVISIKDFKKLTTLVPEGARDITEVTHHTLWDKQQVLILIVILLAIEWFIRKRVNMA